MCELYCLIHLCIDKVKGKKSNILFFAKKKAVKNIFAVASTLVLILLSLFLIQDIIKPKETVTLFKGMSIANQITESINSDEMPDADNVANVYFLNQATPEYGSQLHHQVYFNLIDDNILIKNFYTETNVNPIPKEDFISRLVENEYGYVYIFNSHPHFTEKYGEYFGPDLTLDSAFEFYKFDETGEYLFTLMD